MICKEEARPQQRGPITLAPRPVLCGTTGGRLALISRDLLAYHLSAGARSSLSAINGRLVCL